MAAAPLIARILLALGCAAGVVYFAAWFAAGFSIAFEALRP